MPIRKAICVHVFNYHLPVSLNYRSLKYYVLKRLQRTPCSSKELLRVLSIGDIFIHKPNKCGNLLGSISGSDSMETKTFLKSIHNKFGYV